MKWSKYSSLKTAKKVAFEKVAEVKDSDDRVTKEAYVVLAQKRFNSETGEALADSKNEISLSDLEREKARYDDDMARAKAESDELAKAIADFKKL
ncbi:MAG: hypothetical protein Unbinned202contig1002_2 [Prokaryotic dsDNA virus sp.]|nr:MAG: hypothetical protein Unbinned202contig1002_2 [Prokaryotic dsDNA virus sp.]|tara:strand:+ start:319 stop:603 length:285 start_codon:yes stop_codon:yes gene_type:complete